MGYVLMLLLFLAGGMRNRNLRLDFKSVGPYALCFAFAVCLVSAAYRIAVCVI